MHATISVACFPLSASNSYRLRLLSRQTYILNPPARPDSLQLATRATGMEVLFIVSKKARFSDGRIYS